MLRLFKELNARDRDKWLGKAIAAAAFLWFVAPDYRVILLVGLLFVALDLSFKSRFQKAWRSGIEQWLNNRSSWMSDIVAINYLEQLRQSSWRGVVILGLSTAIAWKLDDQMGILACLSSILLALIRPYILEIRIRRDWHGSTANDVNELLDFINDEIDNTGSPPGRTPLANGDELLRELVEKIAVGSHFPEAAQ